MCRAGQHGVDLRRRMSVREFRHLLHSSPGLATVRLNGIGESTLAPDFAEYISALVDLSLHIELVTNGTGTFEQYRLILDNNGSLYFSWDAASASLFERLRRPARWHECHSTLRRAAKYATDSATGKIGLVFTLQSANIGEFADVVRLAADCRLDSVQLNVIKGPKTQWIDASLPVVTQELARALQIAEEQRLTVYIPDQICGQKTGASTHRTSSTYCTAPATEAVVRWNGDVQICNMFNPYTVGNIYRGGLQQAWQSVFSTLFWRGLTQTARILIAKIAVISLRRMSDSSSIVIIRGAPGSGKTTIARHLMVHFGRGVTVEVDAVRAMINQVYWGSHQQHFDAIKASGALCKHYAEAGYAPVVLVDTLSDGSSAIAVAAVEPMRAKVYSLVCSKRALGLRMMKRLWGFKNAEKAQRINADIRRECGVPQIVFDTSKSDPREVAKEIAHDVNGT